LDRNLFVAFALSFAVLILWTLLAKPPPRSQPAPGGEERPASPEPMEDTQPLALGSLPALEPAEAVPGTVGASELLA
jgi:hypothetical protein